jgi:osmotically-inducible protein OsmY
MTTSSSQRSRDSCGPDDDDLRSAALDRLQSSGYAALRRLQCQVTEGVVIVHGLVTSYFLKQMAQTVIQQLDGIQRVTNLVEVRVADRSGDHEDASAGVDPEVDEYRT